MRKWRNDFVTTNNEQWYDMFDDWALVESSLTKQYGIRIRREIDTFTWGELSNLIAGIMPKTPLGNIISIRSETDPEKLKHFNAEQKKIRQEWLNRKNVRFNEETYDQKMKQLEAIFIQMAKKDGEIKE